MNSKNHFASLINTIQLNSAISLRSSVLFSGKKNCVSCICDNGNGQLKTECKQFVAFVKEHKNVKKKKKKKIVF